MKVINTSKRLLCVQTKKGRVDILPGVVTDNKNLDKLKGKDKIFDHYLKEGILKVVKGNKKSSNDAKKIPEELVQKANDLGIDITVMNEEQVRLAIHEAENDGGE